MSNIERCDAKVDHQERTRVWGSPSFNSRQCTRNAIENSEFCKVHTYNRNPVYRWSTGKNKDWSLEYNGWKKESE